MVSIDLIQPHLFDCRDRERYQVLMQTMDRINRQFGADTIQVAVAGLRKPWQGQKAW